MLHIIDVIGIALFIGIYAYALSTAPLPGGILRVRRPSGGLASLFPGRT